jgi:hypothetical protein
MSVYWCLSKKLIMNNIGQDQRYNGEICGKIPYDGAEFDWGIGI